MRKVLSVGQCGPDNFALSSYLRREFTIEFLTATDLAETLDVLRKNPVDLVLINRKLDLDYTDGMEILKAIKQDPLLAKMPVMIVTNYPEVHAEAEQLGGQRGFGKLEFGKPETRKILEPILG